MSAVPDDFNESTAFTPKDQDRSLVSCLPRVPAIIICRLEYAHFSAKPRAAAMPKGSMDTRFPIRLTVGPMTLSSRLFILCKLQSRDV